MEINDVTISELATDVNKEIYFVDFYGDKLFTTVTTSPAVIRNWIQSTWYTYRCYRDRFVAGLGVQWNPYSNEQAGTFQLCVGSRCLIFQLTHIDSVPNLLRRFLNDPNTTFVDIWNYSDAYRILNSKHQLSLSSAPKDQRPDLFDDPDLRGASMETLVSRFFGYNGLRKDPDVAKSNWNAEWLTDAQILYAAVDTYVSFQMGKVMF